MTRLESLPRCFIEERSMLRLGVRKLACALIRGSLLPRPQNVHRRDDYAA
jgi:hypothetical protein